MGDNDDELGSKKTSLEEAIKTKKDDEEFLEMLGLRLCREVSNISIHSFAPTPCPGLWMGFKLIPWVVG